MGLRGLALQSPQHVARIAPSYDTPPNSMTTFAQTFTKEITRLARRAVRDELASLKQTSLKQREQIAALRSELAQLKRGMHESARAQKKTAAIQAVAVGDKKIRYSAKNLAALRKRLGLSQEDFGVLCGVSAQTVYNWEHRDMRPTDDRLRTIAAARKLSKTDARAIVQPRARA